MIFAARMPFGRSMTGMNLSSVLTHNMHSGAQDLRNLLGTPATEWIPASWQQSLYDLSYSVVGLWDSIMRAFAIFA